MTLFVPEKTNKAGDLLRALYDEVKNPSSRRLMRIL
jgi:hypothetical protein